MTVGELIEKLSQHPKDMLVFAAEWLYSADEEGDFLVEPTESAFEPTDVEVYVGCQSVIIR